MTAGGLTARWEAGSGVLTVSCEHGRVWAYLVIPAGDRPLPHLLHDLPWMAVPGGEWAEDGAEGVWMVPVVPRSPHDAAVLFAPGNPPVASGLVDVNQLDQLSQR